jgi:hypothetical protein
MNDKERSEWINNDEALYNWWRQSRQPLTTFVRQYRKELDAAITPVVEGTKPAHYLVYGHNARERN